MPEAAIYRGRAYNRYGAIRRVEANGRLGREYTRREFEQNINSATMRGGNRNQQTRITQRNFRQRGGNRTFG